MFTGYEGVPEFFNDLLNHITSVLQSQSPDFTPASEQPKSLPVSTTVPNAAPPAPGCCSMLGKEASGSPWIVEGDGGLKGSRQRLGCNTAMSPNFQQHCVSTIATKASSQWLMPCSHSVWSLNKKKQKRMTMVTIIWIMIIIIMMLMTIIYLIKKQTFSYIVIENDDDWV